MHGCNKSFIQETIGYNTVDFKMRCDMLYLLASNLTFNRRIAKVKISFSDEEKRMDRFDAVINEYLRSNRKTVEYLANKVGCDPSSLWRYRRRVEYFRKAPLSVVANCMRMANVSNNDLRYILGLPTGQRDGEN